MRSLTALTISAASCAALVAACSSSNTAGGPVPQRVVGATTSFEACPSAGPSGVALLRCETTVDSPRMALGMCGDLVADNTLTLEAGGANVAVSGTSTTSAPLVVGGDFDSAETVTAKNTQRIGGSLRTGGDWATSAPVTVARDALLAGDLRADNTVDVTGTLRAASIDSPQSSLVQAGRIEQSSAPFDHRLDCANRTSLAAAAQSVVLEPDRPVAFAENALAKVGQTTDLTLGCGTYVLAQMYVGAPLTIHVSSTVVFLVRGNLTIAAPMVVDVAPGATLDFAVEGDVAVNNTLTFSGAADPASVYFAVGGDLGVASPLEVDGSLAVAGALAANNTVDVKGAAFLSDLHVASPFVVHAGASPAPAFGPHGCFVKASAAERSDD